MSATALAILAAIQGALVAAPDVIRVAGEAKNFLANLFTWKVISAAEQNAINAHVDAVCAARLTGQQPPHWQVEPDPA